MMQNFSNDSFVYYIFEKKTSSNLLTVTFLWCSHSLSAVNVTSGDISVDFMNLYRAIVLCCDVLLLEL